MLAQPIRLLPKVKDTLRRLSEHYTLIMITKGDLLDQQKKVRRSGLLKYFRSIEIVSEKNEQTYLEILKKNNISPEDFLMVGNSLKSDILPVTKIGEKLFFRTCGVNKRKQKRKCLTKSVEGWSPEL